MEVPVFLADALFSNVSIPTLGASLFLSVLLVAIWYMVAYVVQTPTLMSNAKEELAALIMTMLILVFFFSMGSFLSSLTHSLYGASGFSGAHFDLARSSLDVFFKKLMNIQIQLYLFEVLIGFLSTISFPLGSPFPAVNMISFSCMPFDGLVLLSNAHTVVVETAFYLSTALISKQMILDFFRYAVPAILFPLGIAMRAFPFSRTTGSSILALCLVGYFVYPLSILLTNYMIFDVYEPVDVIYVPNEKELFTIDANLNNVDAQDALLNRLKDEQEHAKEFRESFTEDSQAVSKVVEAACGSGPIEFISCSIPNFLESVYSTTKGFFSKVISIGSFMWDLGTDFLSGITSNNPFLPMGASSGLYSFILMEVVGVSQFIIAVVVSSVLEIIISVTMYRNIALLIGGDAEIAGLSKLV